MLNRHTELTHEKKIKNAPVPPQSEDFSVDQSKSIIMSFVNQYGDTVNVYAGVDKIADARFTKMKLAYLESL